MKIAVIGTVGVPANYGGFETLVDQLIRNSSKDIEYTVFCSKKSYERKLKKYKGADLRYVNLNANGLQSIPYDIISLCRATRRFDAILILGVSGCSFLPVYRLFSKKKLIINIDGLEHRREKWSKWVRKFLKYSESCAVRHGDIIVTDNKGITDYVKEEYGKDSELIAYGGDQVERTLTPDFINETLKSYGIESGKYAITVCRIEPENNSDMILEAFSKSDYHLVFIGNWQHSEWASQLKEKYADYKNLHLVDAIYNLDILYALRSNAGIYVHGHSAGGTNPSLVEAMFFGIPILAYDVVYNRETTGNRAYYFKTPADILAQLEAVSALNGSPMKEIAARHYTWRHIAEQYCRLFR